MVRTLLVLFGLLILAGCQDRSREQTMAERCNNLDMQIAATQQNDSLQQDAKDQMIESMEQQKAELNCPP